MSIRLSSGIGVRVCMCKLFRRLFYLFLASFSFCPSCVKLTSLFLSHLAHCTNTTRKIQTNKLNSNGNAEDSAETKRDEEIDGIHTKVSEKRHMRCN